MGNKTNPIGKENLEQMHRQAFRDNIQMQPLLIGAYGLSTTVFAGTTLKNGVLLTVSLFLLTVPLCILDNLLLRHFQKHLRVLAMVLCTALLYVPMRLLLPLWFGPLPSVYMYSLPVLVTSPLVIFRTDRSSVNMPLPRALMNMLYTCISYGIIICMTGAVRELLADGTLYGKPLAELPVHTVTAYAAFFGFIVLGFVTAFMKALRSPGKVRSEEEDDA